MTTGYYWYFHLNQKGERLSEKPFILWYCKERNDVTLMGYEVILDFHTESYDIVGRPVYTPSTPTSWEDLVS